MIRSRCTPVVTGCDVLVVQWKTQNGEGNGSQGPVSVNREQQLRAGDDGLWKTLGVYSTCTDLKVFPPKNIGSNGLKMTRGAKRMSARIPRPDV